MTAQEWAERYYDWYLQEHVPVIGLIPEFDHCNHLAGVERFEFIYEQAEQGKPWAVRTLNHYLKHRLTS